MDPQATEPYGQAMPAPLSTPAPQVATQGMPVSSQPVPFPVPGTADDTESLEAAWVAVVEKVVESNKDDPYILNNAVAALRRDYLFKRYGKEAGQKN